MLVSFVAVPRYRQAVCATLWLTMAATSCAATPADSQHARLLQQMLHGAPHGQLLHVALVAGGASSNAEFAHYRYRVDRCIAHARKRLYDRDPQSTLAILQIVLESLHDTLLTGQFCPACDNVCRTLDTGDHNCVTASVVFQIVADDLGLPSQIEFLPRHVRCQITLADGSFVVETTDRQGVRRAVTTDSGRLLNHTELVAKLYYNRALELLRQQDFATALQYAELAWRMDEEHTAARENVAIVACRWAVSLATQQRWAVAISLLHQARLTTGLDQLLGNTEVFVLKSWTQWALSEGSALDRQRVEDELRVAIGQRPGNGLLLQLLQQLATKAS